MMNHLPLRPIGLAICAVAAATIALVILSRFDRRSKSVLRLDWFLPQLRRLKDGERLNSRLVGRTLMSLLPARMKSDRKRKKRGAIRRWLRSAGVGWLASPSRRVVQTVCLLTFGVLFLVVCWPYDAKPKHPQVVLASLQFVSVDQASGEIVFTVDDDQNQPVEGRSVFLAENADATRSFEVAVRAGDDTKATIRVAPLPDATAPLLDKLLTGTTDWVAYDIAPDAWPSHYADNLQRKEIVPAELFLLIDPLVALSTAIATKSWVWSLSFAAAILVVCLLIPRGFCGYLCPLGTTIDFFDWAVTSRTKRFAVPQDGWWVHTKYYLLAGTLIAATCGVLLTGFVSAIPVLTRAMLFIVDPLQSGTNRGFHLIPAMNAGHVLSIVLFAGVLCLGFLRPRFWCKYVCPSGAVFSIGNLFRITERKVESSCIHCNKCVEVCPFDAIKADFTTRETDCTLCQTCGGVCPTHAIKFVERWNVVELKVENEPETGETRLGRRGFLSLAAGSSAAVVGGVTAANGVRLFGANLDDPQSPRPVRPPGSVPEQDFLQQCIRCGECFKACPNDVLQPEGFTQGLEGLWTPEVVADWAGCESSCNACGQVCPTGAIRALPIAEKRFARMGLAIVNETMCLPFAGQEDCDLCVQECNAAGYHAIEYRQVGTQVGPDGLPVEGTGRLAPVVKADDCVGCGLCQTRCYAINVKERGVLKESAIIVEAGEGKEDRLRTGSYIEAAANRKAAKAKRTNATQPANVRRDADAGLNDSVNVDRSPAKKPDAGRTETGETEIDKSAPDPPDNSTLDEDPFGTNPFGL